MTFGATLTGGWPGPAGAPSPPAPPGVDQLADQILGWLRWGALSTGVIGLLICAVLVVIGRRRPGQLAVSGLVGSVWVLSGLALASVSALVVGAVAAIGLGR